MLVCRWIEELASFFEKFSQIQRKHGVLHDKLEKDIATMNYFLAVTITPETVFVSVQAPIGFANLFIKRALHVCFDNLRNKGFLEG